MKFLQNEVLHIKLNLIHNSKLFMIMHSTEVKCTCNFTFQTEQKKIFFFMYQMTKHKTNPKVLIFALN